MRSLHQPQVGAREIPIVGGVIRSFRQFETHLLLADAAQRKLVALNNHNPVIGPMFPVQRTINAGHRRQFAGMKEVVMNWKASHNKFRRIPQAERS